MVSCLCHDDWRIIHLATSLSAVQILIIFIIDLSDYNRSGITCISKNERVFILIDSD